MASHGDATGGDAVVDLQSMTREELEKMLATDGKRALQFVYADQVDQRLTEIKEHPCRFINSQYPAVQTVAR